MTDNRVVRTRDLYPIVGLKPQRVLQLVKTGEFPKPFTITEGGRAYAWLASEVDAWIAKRARQGRIA